LLAAGQLQAALTDPGGIAIWQMLDEIVDRSAPRRRFDLCLSGTGTAIADIVTDRVVEQHRVLRDDADGRPQRGLSHLGDILPVEPEAAGAYNRKTIEQASQR